MHHVTCCVYTDCCYQRSRDAIVTVSSTRPYTTPTEGNTCAHRPGIFNRNVTLIICSQILTGQYAQLQFFNTSIMNLFEVEVHGF